MQRYVCAASTSPPHTMKKQNAERHLISRRQLASRWEVSTETLKRREKAGTLPLLKLGTRVRYRLTDIEQIEQQAEVSR